MANSIPVIFFKETDDLGAPLSGGKLYAYEAGTSTPKITYTEPSGTVASANPIILNSAGRCSVWLGNGGYKFVLKDSSDNVIWTKDDIGLSSSAGVSTTVGNIQSLRDLSSGYSNYVSVFVSDTSPLNYTWDPDSSDSDNGFSIIIPSSYPASGRWILNYNQVISSSVFTNLAIAISSVGVIPLTLQVSRAETVSSNLNIPSTISLEVLKGGSFTSSNTSTLTISGQFKSLNTQIFSGNLLVYGLTGIVSSTLFSTLSASITALGSSVLTLQISRAETVSSNLTIPSTMAIDVIKGGSFNISTSIVLTINGQFTSIYFKVFNCSGTGSVTFGNNSTQIMIPQWWGALGNGSTVDTVAFQSAVTAAESNTSSVFVPPGNSAYKVGRVNILTGYIKIFGDNTKIIHVYDGVEGSGGAGSTKASPVFFCTKTSTNIEITGFVFTTYDASFPSVPGWMSYLAPIIINRADYVNIHHNTFAGNQDRGVFLYGGNFCSVKNNYFDNTSMIMHIGITANENFWDDTTSYATVYGPESPIISDNIFSDYTFTNNCLFLSGPNHFTVTNNKFIGFNNAASVPVRLYVNDLGMFSGDGTALNAQYGILSGNTIKGVFESAIEIAGQAGGTTESLLTFYLRYKVENNSIEGEGVGINIERAYDLDVLNNNVKTTNTPLYIKRELTDCKLNGNYLECTDVSDIVPAIDSTIVFDSNAVIIRSEMNNNQIIGPEDDLYIFFTPPGVLLRDFTFRSNILKYNSSVASNRAMQFNHTGILDFSDNLFYINSSTFTDRHICAINKTIGAWDNDQGYNPGYTVIPTVPNGYQYMTISPVGDSGGSEPSWPTTIGNTVVDNEVTWICQELKARAIITKNKVVYANVRNRGIDVLSNSVYFSDNLDFQQVSLAGTDVSCTNNRIESWTSSTTVNLIVENTTHAYVAGNFIVRPFNLNSAVVSMDSVTYSKIVGNYIAGDSNSSLVRSTVVGKMEQWGNTIVNNGAGDVGFAVTSAALARSMNQDSQGSDVASANDMTLGMNGTYFDITGNTTINGIYAGIWQAGQMITLQFDSTPTVKHNTAPSAGFAKFLLAGAVDFVASVNDTLTLRFDGTYFREISRAVI